MNAVANRQDILAIEAAQWPGAAPASTWEMIHRGAAIDPAAPALSFFETAQTHRDVITWDYRQLIECITRAGNFFHALGVGAHDVVTYLLPNLPETHFTVWGAQAVGIVGAVNPLLDAPAIAEILAAMDTRVLVTLGPGGADDTWPKLSTVLPQIRGLRHLVLVDPEERLRPDCAAARATAPIASAPAVRATLPAGVTAHNFSAGLRRQPGDRLLADRAIDGAQVSSLFCTGGTTGTPKIAVRSHGNEVANARSLGQVLGPGIGSGKTLFCGLPMFHVNAVMVTGLLPFSTGAHVLLGTAAGFRGAGVLGHFWEIVAHHRVNFFSAVPTVYAALLQVPCAGQDLSSLEYGLCGAAPMPIEVLNTFQQRTGLRILEGYGLTEAACVSSVNPPAGERRPGSIGLRLPGQDMKAVVLDEAGRWLRECGVDEIGVIAVHGPNVFSGYRVAEHERGLWLESGDGRRWLNTGDLGRCDAEGYFWLTGRRKELIIRGGHNIDPQSIEEPMHRHPAVELAAAVGRPDAHAGELPVVYVQLRSGAQVTEAELLDHAAKHIGERAAQPRAVRIVERMPLTAVGKIFKPALKHREIREALGHALAETGIVVRAMNVAEDSKRGTCIEVELEGAAQEAIAREVLGRFAFAFALKSGVDATA